MASSSNRCCYDDLMQMRTQLLNKTLYKYIESCAKKNIMRSFLQPITHSSFWIPYWILLLFPSLSLCIILYLLIFRAVESFYSNYIPCSLLLNAQKWNKFECDLRSFLLGNLRPNSLCYHNMIIFISWNRFDPVARIVVHYQWYNGI